ncbi:hypothetical protein PFY12_14750 [Chryseobacterium camelliae]|uniref:Uncharacterized protein n=1 Tax=Chryseobacterium camelliae TaxID=1265445 RepID=A0ABY7QKT5_9FLAO|nr:hypothetical protein [Chryseobacterium camelliae]WBV60285.1 hypothetical protein PFY12_14750 [Chryseobacterium camelliae]
MIPEKELDEFLSNLLIEERSIEYEVYMKRYNKTFDHVNKCFLLISNKKRGWIGNSGTYMGIAPGYKPVVEDFLYRGGFVKEKEKEEFEMTAKKASHELIVKQSKEIKITRTISIISLIIAFLAILIAIYK